MVGDWKGKFQVDNEKFGLVAFYIPVKYKEAAEAYLQSQGYSLDTGMENSLEGTEQGIPPDPGRYKRFAGGDRTSPMGPLDPSLWMFRVQIKD